MGSDGGLIEDLEVATFWDLFWRRKSPNLVVENCGRWAVGGLGEEMRRTAAQDSNSGGIVVSMSAGEVLLPVPENVGISKSKQNSQTEQTHIEFGPKM